MQGQQRLCLLALSLVLLAVFALTPNLRVKASDDEHVTFTTIDPPGTIFTIAAGINPQGDIVGRYYDGSVCNLALACGADDGHNHGFLLTGSEFTSIDFPGAFLTAVSGIDNRGDIVGVYVDTNRQGHGFLRTP
jgi:uncharacterized membrane protein